MNCNTISQTFFPDQKQTLRTSVTFVYLAYLCALIYASFNLEHTFVIITVCLSLHFFFLLSGIVLSMLEGYAEFWPYNTEELQIQLTTILKIWDLVQCIVLIYSIIINFIIYYY